MGVRERGRAHCQAHGQSWSLCQRNPAELGEGERWMDGGHSCGRSQGPGEGSGRLPRMLSHFPIPLLPNHMDS